VLQRFKMPCHISDGPQTPEDAEPDLQVEDEDAGYDLRRQDEIDLYTAPVKG